MNRRDPNQLYEVFQKTKRNNIYTNQGLHNGNENLKCFSSNRPLSAQQPYHEMRRSPHTYLRSKQRHQRSPKPMKIGKFNRPPEQNFNLYFDKRQYESKSLYKPKLAKSRSSQRNIYIGKNINTSYGCGVFKANYQNLFMQFPYQGQEKSRQKELKRDLYTKYKTKAPFKPSGRAIKTLEDQNKVRHKNITDPYKPVNEQYIFRGKSPTNKFLSRFQWKPMTQYIKKSQT